MFIFVSFFNLYLFNKSKIIPGILLYSFNSIHVVKFTFFLTSFVYKIKYFLNFFLEVFFLLNLLLLLFQFICSVRFSYYEFNSFCLWLIVYNCKNKNKFLRKRIIYLHVFYLYLFIFVKVYLCILLLYAQFNSYKYYMKKEVFLCFLSFITWCCLTHSYGIYFWNTYLELGFYNMISFWKFLYNIYFVLRSKVHYLWYK